MARRDWEQGQRRTSTLTWAALVRSGPSSASSPLLRPVRRHQPRHCPARRLRPAPGPALLSTPSPALRRALPPTRQRRLVRRPPLSCSYLAQCALWAAATRGSPARTRTPRPCRWGAGAEQWRWACAGRCGGLQICADVLCVLLLVFALRHDLRSRGLHEPSSSAAEPAASTESSTSRHFLLLRCGRGHRLGGRRVVSELSGSACRRV